VTRPWPSPDGAAACRSGGWLAYDGGVGDSFTVTCPCCGEEVEIYIETDVRGTFIQDCEVCCRPWQVRVTGAGADRQVDVAPADE